MYGFVCIFEFVSARRAWRALYKRIDIAASDFYFGGTCSQQGARGGGRESYCSVLYRLYFILCNCRNIMLCLILVV